MVIQQLSLSHFQLRIQEFTSAFFLTPLVENCWFYHQFDLILVGIEYCKLTKQHNYSEILLNRDLASLSKNDMELGGLHSSSDLVSCSYMGVNSLYSQYQDMTLEYLRTVSKTVTLIRLKLCVRLKIYLLGFRRYPCIPNWLYPFWGHVVQHYSWPAMRLVLPFPCQLS